MLGLFALYFIWKRFSELALVYNKNRWAYALSGIASFYAGNFAGGIILVVTGMLLNSDFVDTSSDLLVGVMALPFGILAVWGLYTLLANNWRKTPKNQDNDALDSELFKASDTSDF